MPDFSVHRASELGRDERLLFERWLGRELAADETISVNAWRPHDAPRGERMEALRREIVRRLMRSDRARLRCPRKKPMNWWLRRRRRFAVREGEDHSRFECAGSRADQSAGPGIATAGLNSPFTYFGGFAVHPG